MAKVSLISCNRTEEPYPVYPLGLSMVAAALRQKGHSVSEYDVYAQGRTEKEVEHFVRLSQPDYVGLSLRNIDTANYNKQDAYVQGYRQIVDAVRRATKAPVILGGSAYTIFPKKLLNELGADYGIAGEGEEAFCHLLDQLENEPEQAYPIYYNFTPMINFGARERSESLTRFYLEKGGMLSVQTKRGCPHRCAYCSYPILEGNRYRFRPADQVVDEIEMLIQKYKADYFSITDSVFNDATGHYLKIAKELVRRDNKTPWMCFLRPKNFTEEDADILTASGLDAVEWGTDCTTDETLTAMKKDFTWEQVIHSNNLFAQKGVSNAHFIIFGGPGETNHTLEQGLENLKALQNCVVFAGIGVRIFPKTDIHRRALEEKKITANDDLLEPTYYFSDAVDVNSMHERILKAFEGRMDRIYPDGQYTHVAKAYHAAGNRGPAWDMLLKQNIHR